MTKLPNEVENTEYLEQIFQEIKKMEEFNWPNLRLILNRFAKVGGVYFSKDQLFRFYQKNSFKLGFSKDSKIKLLELLKLKPMRTQSGVATVTVLTKPFSCPGQCIFCPNDVRMPKSYISSEPGAQRAERNYFDPYLQTYRRLQALQNIGHSIDKIEIIILGGTWSFYPEKYQIWFISRIFEAVNDLSEGKNQLEEIEEIAKKLAIDPKISVHTLSKIQNENMGKIALEETIDLKIKSNPFNQKNSNLKTTNLTSEIEGVASHQDLETNAKAIFKKSPTTYNQVVSQIVAQQQKILPNWEKATWLELLEAQKINETTKHRIVGLVVETRPDHISDQELIRIRKLGATKVQIGFQSLNNAVLDLNKRGHTVEETAKAVKLIRLAGFKIHAHWMANLYGSTAPEDILDFQKIFTDPNFCPDELKIYPCSLVETAELVDYYKKGLWHPYTHEELTQVLTEIIPKTPEYCRLTRIIRDIPGNEILVGNKVTNLRQIVEEKLKKQGIKSKDIRAREIKNQELKQEDLELKIIKYPSSIGTEYFLQFATKNNQIAGFLRLSLPLYFPTTKNFLSWQKLVKESLLATDLSQETWQKYLKNHKIPFFKHPFLSELNHTAMIREVHIYGQLVDLGNKSLGKAQHLGLGSKLILKAKAITKKLGYSKLAVISSIGTRKYYQKHEFKLGELYQIWENPDLLINQN